MAKIKQSIAVQRQIPEHIRENYPVFVEFIKSYYDFLQQTQQQNLETIHDVDTTLDEFIDRFKILLLRLLKEVVVTLNEFYEYRIIFSNMFRDLSLNCNRLFNLCH
jgi:hypothetical protein